MRTRFASLVLALGLALFSALSAGAQTPSGQCDILENERIQRRLDGGMPMIYITGPFRIRCAGGEELRALQGTVNEWTREIVLSGNVFFQDPAQTLTAQDATYNANLGRLYATGNVVFTNREEGSTLRGPELEYFREMEGRPDALVNAGQRPTLTLRPRDAAEDAEPMEVDADQVSILGQDELSAYGNVVIQRSDLHATAEEAQYDAASEGLELRRNAQIQSERFNLAGQVVRARMPEGVLEYVHAQTEASVVGDELEVTAPDVQLFFVDELLQRAVARVPRSPEGERIGRAVASARSFRLEGDSIDALTPNQQVEQVIAIGRARGESIDTTRVEMASLAGDTLAADLEIDAAAPGLDSLQFAAADTAVSDSVAAARAIASLIDRDWIVGDTIIGFFEPPAITEPAEEGADTTVVLRRIIAQGKAQSLYRVEPQNGSADPQRPLNYLAGELIELNFLEGELQIAEVTGLRLGLYLDPLPTPPAPDEESPPTEEPPPAGEGASDA